MAWVILFWFNINAGKIEKVFNLKFINFSSFTIKTSSTLTNTTKGMIYFSKKSLYHDISSVTSGRLLQVKTTHNAQHI